MPITMPTPTTIKLSSMNNHLSSTIAIMLFLLLATFLIIHHVVHSISRKSQIHTFKHPIYHQPGEPILEVMPISTGSMLILIHLAMEQIVPFLVPSSKSAAPILQEQAIITPYNPHQCFVMEIESLLSLVVVIPSQPSGVH